MRGLHLGPKRGARSKGAPVASRLARAISASMPAGVPLDCVIRFTFEGHQTSGKNQQGRTRSGHVYPKQVFVSWRDSFGQQFLMQKQPWSRYFPLSEPVVIWITYVPGDARIRDVPGMEDALWHLFEWVGFLKNDTYLQGVVWRTAPMNRTTPGVDVEIFPAHWSWNCTRTPPVSEGLPTGKRSVGNT